MEAIFTYIVNTFTFTKIKIFLTIIFGFFGTLMGGFTIIVKAMFILLILDFILGFMVAWIDNTISKKRIQLGIVKLMTYSITIIVLHFTNLSVMGFNINGFGIQEFGIAYLSINETLSCVRHLGVLGVPLPVGLISKLENYKESLTINDFKNNSQNYVNNTKNT